MYSGEGVEENVSGGEKENSLRCVGKKIRRTFASIANVRLHVLRTYIRGCYNERSLVLERTFASAITVV